MGGIGLLLNTTKDALLNQQYAISVIGHNIANVNTEGYSRQVATLQAKLPAPFAGFIFGRGVELYEITRYTDSFIETQLRDRKSDFASLTEKETYMKVMEGIFNENSSRSLSTQLADFWNAWNDLSNNPSGLSERNVMYEMGSLLSQSFKDIGVDMTQFEREITLSVEAAVSKVNQLTAQIATLNQQIMDTEVNSNANDLRDQRDVVVAELAEYIDINSQEYDDGNLMITATRGYVLVNRADSYDLSINGTDVEIQGSSGQIVITDRIAGGKLDGWLDMRDEIIPKYKADLDELAKSIAWEVNKIHTQGVGTQAMSSVTGTYTATSAVANLDSSGLVFESDISAGQFSFWVYDDTGAVVNLGGPGGSLTVAVDPTADSITDIRNTLNGLDGGNITATVNADNTLSIATANNRTFAFSGDTSNVLAALGINTFYDGSTAAGLSVNSVLETTKEYMAAGRLDAAGNIASGDNTNALALADLQFTDVTVAKWTYQRGSTPTSSNITGTIDNYLHNLIGSVGILTQSTTRGKEYSEEIVNHLNETRNSISGVSLDEELTNLIKYQHAYTAAARLITAADEMLKTLVNSR